MRRLRPLRGADRRALRATSSFWDRDRLEEVTDAYLHGVEAGRRRGARPGRPGGGARARAAARSAAAAVLPALRHVGRAPGRQRPRLAAALTALGAARAGQGLPARPARLSRLRAHPEARRCWRDTFAFLDASALGRSQRVSAPRAEAGVRARSAARGRAPGCAPRSAIGTSTQCPSSPSARRCWAPPSAPTDQQLELLRRRRACSSSPSWWKRGFSLERGGDLGAHVGAAPEGEVVAHDHDEQRLDAGRWPRRSPNGEGQQKQPRRLAGRSRRGASPSMPMNG